LRKDEKARFRNEEIGFVFQFHNLLPEFTALENVCIPGYIKNKAKWKNVEARASELLHILGIEDRADHKPSQMSGGEQQRTAIARALINEPSLIFADEPSGNLDSKNAEELHELFFDLRKELGQTFVLVTHNEELANLADRRLEIKDGLIVGQQVSKQ
jgi:lipoprotein-releasing system ATP-binding protein